MSKEIAIANAKSLAATFQIAGDPGQLLNTLSATAFRGADVTPEQMTALLIVSKQHGLNPWLKEIYAFPDKGGIVPVVGVDGWTRIINSHPQFDGIEFEQDEDKCTCTIYRKDRSHPVKVTEWMSECVRNTGPWKSHPRRLLRHKALIQCARLAFSFAGIHDPDEAERIVEAERDVSPEPASRQAQPAYPEDVFAANLPKWRAVIESGRKSAEDIIAMVSTKGALSAAQREAIMACEPLDGEIAEDAA